jgi:uncharacterized protein HemX
MTSPKWSTQISLGNVLTIVFAVLTAGAVWGAAQQDIISVRLQQDRVEARVEQLYQALQQASRDHAAAIAAQDARLRHTEATAARETARLDAILQGITRIEGRLDRMEERP